MYAMGKMILEGEGVDENRLLRLAWIGLASEHSDGKYQVAYEALAKTGIQV